MKTSTEIGSIAKICGEEKAIEYVAKAGFDAWDFSLFDLCRYDRKNFTVLKTGHALEGTNYLSYSRKLRQLGEDNGIICNQTHAPFPLEVTEVRSNMKRAIECTAEVGASVCVIHPQKNLSPKENAQIYMELLPFAKEYRVKLAAENIWNWDSENKRALFAACSTPESFCEHLNAVDDDNFVACLDIGHAEMMGSDVSAVRMIKALGSKLQALHIHDNDKRIDHHQIPFSMDIDFVSIVKALKEIDYKGFFTMESTDFFTPFTKDNIFDGVKTLSLTARKLADMFDE